MWGWKEWIWSQSKTGNQISREICKAVGVFCMQWDSVEASTKWRSCFPYVTTKDGVGSSLGTMNNGMGGKSQIWRTEENKLNTKGKKEWGQTLQVPLSVDAKEIRGRGDMRGQSHFESPVLGTRCTVIELKAWGTSRLDSSFWSSNSRKFMWEISSRQSLQRQISCFPTKFPS